MFTYNTPDTDQSQQRAPKECLNITWEELYDFPMSWDWWRHYSVYHTGVDPGPCEPPEHTIEELHERVTDGIKAGMPSGI